MGKVFGKKIRSPGQPARRAPMKKKRGRLFFQNPQGPTLTMWPAHRKFAVHKRPVATKKAILTRPALKENLR